MFLCRHHLKIIPQLKTTSILFTLNQQLLVFKLPANFKSVLCCIQKNLLYSTEVTPHRRRAITQNHLCLWLHSISECFNYTAHFPYIYTEKRFFYKFDFYKVVLQTTHQTKFHHLYLFRKKNLTCLHRPRCTTNSLIPGPHI